MKTGVILANLGTPAAPTPKAIRQFLRPFLQDKRVIQEIHPWLWRIVLEGVILPFRPKKFVHKYQQIWLKEGSPLLVYSERQQKALSAALQPDDIPVTVAMTYGEPSFSSAVATLEAAGCERIIVIPLFPQYSSTTTAAAFDALARAMAAKMVIPEIVFIADYYRHPLYIQAISRSITDYWQQHGRGDLLLFSFHGIPVSYCERGDTYPEACMQTVAAVATALQLKPSEYALSYQSRLGYKAWLQPYTIDFVAQQARAGAKRIDVIAPGFATDCLETWEELQIQNKATFLAAGGEEFHYISALNDSDDHIALLAALVHENIG
jgi:ferrochelatase